MKKVKFKIKGMTCSSCSTFVEKQIEELDGIRSKKINHVTDNAKIEFDENTISEQEIISKINEGHYKVVGFENISGKEKVSKCPVCLTSGKKVPNTVFKSNLIIESFHKIILEAENFICTNPDCEIAYFENENTIKLNELKRGLWFKKATKNKIICYCNNISKYQIKEAVTKLNLNTWEEITSHYRKKVIERCEILNPTGYCCRETFRKVVNKKVAFAC